MLLNARYGLRALWLLHFFCLHRPKSTVCTPKPAGGVVVSEGVQPSGEPIRCRPFARAVPLLTLPAFRTYMRMHAWLQMGHGCGPNIFGCCCTLILGGAFERAAAGWDRHCWR
ncbi:hypothetical protein EON67_00075 [archaeon]|nr:MAG: hypothetical protein EON67_00075 [archaeon]